MSWAEVKKINSDLTKSLDELVNELSEEEVTLINSIITKLDNTTYGLSALKTEIDVNETLLKNSTYGLSALKTVLNTINTNSAKLNNSTYGLEAIKTLLNTVNTNAALLNNSTYGLSALKSAITSSGSGIGAHFEVGSDYTVADLGSFSDTSSSSSNATIVGGFIAPLSGVVCLKADSVGSGFSSNDAVEISHSVEGIYASTSSSHAIINTVAEEIKVGYLYSDVNQGSLSSRCSFEVVQGKEYEISIYKSSSSKFTITNLKVIANIVII